MVLFFTGYVRLDGTPVERDKHNHPYSYEEYVLWKSKKFNGKYEDGAYSDRILQWDWDKHDKLCLEYFGNKGQNWNNRNPKDTEIDTEGCNGK